MSSKRESYYWGVHLFAVLLAGVASYGVFFLGAGLFMTMFPEVHVTSPKYIPLAGAFFGAVAFLLITDGWMREGVGLLGILVTQTLAEFGLLFLFVGLCEFASANPENPLANVVRCILYLIVGVCVIKASTFTWRIRERLHF